MTDGQKPLWTERWFQLLLGSLVLLTVASFVLPWLLGLVYALRSVLLPLVVALGLAYIFNPIVTWMHRRLKLPRWMGTGAVFVGAIWVVLILGLLIVPPMVSQGSTLIIDLKTYPQRISQFVQKQADLRRAETAEETETGDVADATETTIDEAPTASEALDGDPSAADTEAGAAEPGIAENLQLIVEDALGKDRATELLAETADVLSKLDWNQVAQAGKTSLGYGVGIVGSAVSLTGYIALSVVIIGFCFFFFSWKLDKLIAWFVPFIPASHRNEVLGVMGLMDKSVAAFIRGRLVQASVMAFVLSVGWWLAGVPSWLLLGVLSGVLNLVPFAAVVGFLVALLLAVVDAVAGGGFGIWVLVWPTFVYLLAQGLDGWVIEPLVQGKATDLDPVSVLLAVMIGGALAGLLGMLIAIPTAACIKILSREVVLPRLRRLAAGNEAADVT